MHPIATALRGMVLATTLLATASAATRAVTVVIGAQPTGPAIPAQALGLSIETSSLRPNAEGVRTYRPDNRALLDVFRTVGVTHLRVGGNSVDDRKVPLPSLDDVRALFEFARRARVKVIYSVRLQDGDPASSASYARLIHQEFREVLEAFAIGNEPAYYKDYEVYRAKWTPIRDAIVREFPDARFAGPDANPEPKLIKQLVQDYGTRDGRLVQLTQHNYPFGCSYRNPSVAWKDPKAVGSLIPFDPAEARQRMVSAPPYSVYEEVLQGMKAAVAGTPLTFRLTETNSFWFSGLEGASDRYASALWGVEYLHWWVSRGAAGLNFHTGDRTGGSVNLPCRYAAYVTSPQGYEVRPLAYGMKLFSLHGTGRYLSVNVNGDSSDRVAAYATAQDDGRCIVTLVNRDAAAEATFSLQLPAPVRRARTLDLRASGNDLGADSTSVTLGGSPIDARGHWRGKWTKLKRPSLNGQALTVTLPPASATVVEITP